MFKAVSRFIAWCALVRYQPQVRFARVDALVALLFGMLAAAISYHGSGQLNPAIYERRNYDIWFDANPSRVIGAMIEPSSGAHLRTSVHPLFSLLTTPAMGALTALGVEPLQAGRGMIATCGFLATAFLLLALRGLGLPRAVAALFTGVFLASATFVHWFSIIETYAFAAVSTSFMLLVLTSVRDARWLLWLVASIATLSVTVTNWTLALTSMLFRIDHKRAISLSVATYMVVVALAVAQKFLYPHANLFFLPSSVIAERKFVLIHPKLLEIRSWTPISNIWSVTVTSAVTAAPEVGEKLGRPAVRLVSNQHSPLASHTLSGWIALGSWLVLLVAGALGGWANSERRAVFAAVSLFLLGQCVLHAIYGELTFLYAANFFAALVLFTAFGWFSPLRMPAVIAAVAFVIFGGASNFAQFEAATRIVHGIMLGP